MKKLAVLFLFGLFITTLSAQSNAINKHFAAYQRDANFSKMTVSNRMFAMFTEIKGDNVDEEEIYAALSKIKGVKALKFNKEENCKKLYFDAIETIQNDGSYEELMTVEDAGENMQFMLREEDGKIAELIGIVGGNKIFAVMSVYGEIDLNTIAKLAKVLNIKGMEAFEALEKN